MKIKEEEKIFVAHRLMSCREVPVQKALEVLNTLFPEHDIECSGNIRRNIGGESFTIEMLFKCIPRWYRSNTGFQKGKIRYFDIIPSWYAGDISSEEWEEILEVAEKLAPFENNEQEEYYGEWWLREIYATEVKQRFQNHVWKGMIKERAFIE